MIPLPHFMRTRHSRRKFLRAAAAFPLALGAAAARADDETTIRLTVASSQGTTLAWVGAMRTLVVPELDRRLAARGSPYRIRWTEAYGGSLYKYGETLEGVSIGLTDMGWVGTLWELSKLPLQNGYGWRVRLESTVEEFEDGLLGRQRQVPADQCGDFLIRDRLGNWTYQFAVTVDDWRQGVDLVVRGVDLLESTGRQIQLARLLGREAPPAFVHHPLLLKRPDQKLSKSDRDTGIRELRAAGWSRQRIVAEIARRIDSQRAG